MFKQRAKEANVRKRIKQKALDAFLHQYLASTQLSHLTPYDYALQYLELPLDQPHDLEETYELFWGVCCLEDEFLAFQKTLPRVRAEPARPKLKQADIAAGSTADAFSVGSVSVSRCPGREDSRAARPSRCEHIGREGPESGTTNEGTSACPAPVGP